MSKEFAEKNKNKKTPQEIKAEAQAKANSTPAPTKSAPKPTQNTTIVKPSQKKAEQVSAQISAQTSSKSETKATPGMSLSGVKDKAKDYGKQFVEGVKKYATTSKAEKGQESTREKWAREAEEENRFAQEESRPRRFRYRRSQDTSGDSRLRRPGARLVLPERQSRGRGSTERLVLLRRRALPAHPLVHHT